MDKPRRQSRAERRRRRQDTPVERRRGFYRRVEIRTTKMDEAVICTTFNEVVAENCYPFVEALKRIIEKANKKVVLDLRGVPYMDSTAVGLLVDLQQFANQQGKKLYLSGLRAQPRNLIDILALDKILKFLD